MKRIIVVLVLALAIAGLAAAEGINLGSFPLGTWLDSNYSAIWEFSTGNIRILSPSGTVYYDFDKATIQDLKVGLENGAATLSFSCKATGKFYKFTKSLADTSLILEIDPPWKVHYKVTMAKQ